MFAGDYTLRCRACEAQLGKARIVTPAVYGLVENKHGATVRMCRGCGCKQLWLSWVEQLPNLVMKVRMKMIDKLL